MILADLDRELTALVTADVAAGKLPERAGAIRPGRTWRRAPDSGPASFATSLAFELAGLAGQPAEQLARRLAGPLRRLTWVAAAEPTANGYLTVTVTRRALGHGAARLAGAGTAAAAGSAILAGTTTALPPWPDPAAAPGWRRAWQDHGTAMTARLAQAAGASVTRIVTAPDHRPEAAASAPSAVGDAVGWFGAASVRYGLAHTAPGRVGQLDMLFQPGSWGGDLLEPVAQARDSAESTLRWGADLRVYPRDPAELLAAPAEQELLGLLPWLPVRVAAAAARHRPDELPAFLEDVAAAWLAVRQEAPALPFAGGPGAGPALAGARLTLASATLAVLNAGLVLTGADPGPPGDP